MDNTASKHNRSLWGALWEQKPDKCIQHNFWTVTSAVGIKENPKNGLRSVELLESIALPCIVFLVIQWPVLSSSSWKDKMYSGIRFPFITWITGSFLLQSNNTHSVPTDSQKCVCFFGKLTNILNFSWRIIKATINLSEPEAVPAFIVNKVTNACSLKWANSASSRRSVSA